MPSRNNLVFVLLSISLISIQTSAQQSSTGSSSSQTKSSTQHAKPAPSTGNSDEGTYHNPTFGITYRVRYGWVDRTRQMQDENNQPPKTQLLPPGLEHPPEATGETVNSAVIIAAESIASYPGLKTAADYMGP